VVRLPADHLARLSHLARRRETTEDALVEEASNLPLAVRDDGGVEDGRRAVIALCIRPMPLRWCPVEIGY